ncbi:MAG: type II toxin-antitoxin system prevent-host-death family antitoxin [Terriglobia bacterium]
MQAVGVYDAKTHLLTLLDRVARGETITITRRGIPAAMLAPVRGATRKPTHEEITEGMRELRKRVKPDRMSVREMISEGRPRKPGAKLSAPRSKEPPWIEDNELRLSTVRTRLARAQQRLRRYIKPGRSLAKEFIAERRAAARHE